MESTNNTSTFLPTDNTPNTRKPNLPAKFQKYLAFAFFFSNLLKDNNLINDDIFYKALSLFYAFDSFDSQTSFFHSFELNFKPILKSFKLFIKEREKSNKPKKSKKSNKTNTTTSDEAVINAEETSENTEKPKKQRKSKKNTEVPTTETLANNEETSDTAEKPKKQRKSKKNTVTLEETPTNNEETSETAEKPKKQRKSKKEKKGSQNTEEKSDLIHELLTLANSEPDEV
jgi:hypothetical protein